MRKIAFLALSFYISAALTGCHHNHNHGGHEGHEHGPHEEHFEHDHDEDHDEDEHDHEGHDHDKHDGHDHDSEERGRNIANGHSHNEDFHTKDEEGHKKT